MPTQNVPILLYMHALDISLTMGSYMNKGFFLQNKYKKSTISKISAATA